MPFICIASLLTFFGIKSDPMIDYCSIQQLAQEQDVGSFIPKEAYLSLKYYTFSRVYDAPGLSVADLVQILKNATQEWGTSEQNNRLKHLLCSESVLSGVNKAIGVACGSLEYESEDMHRSAIQHALLLSIRDHLSVKNECAGIQCYSQEPEYSVKEKQALKEAGITVLVDPKAFLEVDDASIVVSICPDIPVMQIIAEIARPAAIIWWEKGEETEPPLQ